MKLYEDQMVLCKCKNCGVSLVAGNHSAYSNVRKYCGNCGHDVTEGIYGKKQAKDMVPVYDMLEYKDMLRNGEL